MDLGIDNRVDAWGWLLSVWRNERPWGHRNVLNLLRTLEDFEILVKVDDRHHVGHCQRTIFKEAVRTECMDPNKL